MASLGWAVAVLPRVLVSTEEPRFGGHASGGPITHVMVSFVGASTGPTSRALGTGALDSGPQASHFPVDDFVVTFTPILKDSNLRLPWLGVKGKALQQSALRVQLDKKGGQSAIPDHCQARGRAES